MADVKWIKIVTDIFDDEKIMLIESLPDADSIIVIWFKLLCLAGKTNNSGVFLMSDRIPYTEEMFATIFRRNINTVRLALTTFEQFGMIEIVDGVVTIPNWGKHQTLDQIEERNEYMRKYMQEYRNKQKARIECKSNSKVNSKVNGKSNSKLNVNSLEEDIDKDIDKIREDNEVSSLRSDTSCGESDKPPTPPKEPPEPVFIKIPLNDKTEYEVTEKKVAEYQETYPAVDIRQQLRNMRQWSIDNPTKRKTRVGITRFMNSWMQREQDRGGSRAYQQQSKSDLDEWVARKEREKNERN